MAHARALLAALQPPRGRRGRRWRSQLPQADFFRLRHAPPPASGPGPPERLRQPPFGAIFSCPATGGHASRGRPRAPDTSTRAAPSGGPFAFTASRGPAGQAPRPKRGQTPRPWRSHPAPVIIIACPPAGYIYTLASPGAAARPRPLPPPRPPPTHPPTRGCRSAPRPRSTRPG